MNRAPTSRLAADPGVDCRLLEKTDDYLFFEKGAGVPSVALSPGETGTAANWLLSVDPAQGELHPLEGGLAHRLDTATSGVMVAARNAAARSRLKGLFATKSVDKIYSCLVSGTPPRPGVYQAFAGKHPKSARKVAVALAADFASRRIRGKAQAIQTEILSAQKQAPHHRLKIRLVTGYRHQIRAHLAALDCPLVGDALYGGEKAPRLMLHAERLSFESENGKTLSAESPAPF